MCDSGAPKGGLPVAHLFMAPPFDDWTECGVGHPKMEISRNASDLKMRKRSEEPLNWKT